jgi:hypothetical protein
MDEKRTKGCLKKTAAHVFGLLFADPKTWTAVQGTTFGEGSLT